MSYRDQPTRRSRGRCPHVAVCAVLTAASGCSFVAVTPAPGDARRGGSESRECTDSYTAPVADTAIGGLFTAGAIALAVSAANYEEPVDDCSSEDPFCGSPFPSYGNQFETAGAILLAIPAVVHAASAVYGYVSVDECRDLAGERVRDREREEKHRRFYQR